MWIRKIETIFILHVKLSKNIDLSEYKKMREILELKFLGSDQESPFLQSHRSKGVCHLTNDSSLKMNLITTLIFSGAGFY